MELSLGWMQPRNQTEFLYRVTGRRWNVCGSDGEWERDSVVSSNSALEHSYDTTIMFFIKTKKSEKAYLYQNNTYVFPCSKERIISSIKNSSYIRSIFCIN